GAGVETGRLAPGARAGRDGTGPGAPLPRPPPARSGEGVAGHVPDAAVRRLLRGNDPRGAASLVGARGAGADPARRGDRVRRPRAAPAGGAADGAVIEADGVRLRRSEWEDVDFLVELLTHEEVEPFLAGAAPRDRG